MNKSRQKKVKAKKVKRTGYVSKERKYDSDCQGPSDISNMKPAESNSDAGRITPYNT
jgi:hypothetical protein